MKRMFRISGGLLETTQKKKKNPICIKFRLDAFESKISIYTHYEHLIFMWSRFLHLNLLSFNQNNVAIHQN